MDEIVPYCGPAPEVVWTAWNFAPLPLSLSALPLVAAAFIPAPRRGAAAFASAMLFVAFVSPLCALTVALFAARGLHHLLLILAAAPALALAFPIRRPGTHVAGFIGLSVCLWLWHLPAAYTQAWNNPAIYWLMQAGLVGSAWAFWSYVLHAERPRERIAATGSVLALTGQMGLIAALLTFSPRILYPQHAPFVTTYGIDALADQQLAGLVMWVPGMLPLALLGALLLRHSWRELALP